MQRSLAKNFCNQISRHNRIQLRSPVKRPPCDVFINHRGIDTKRTISGLLYDHLARLRLNPFLDSKNMRPGDRLFDKIDAAIHDCKVGIAVFSPRYCESYFCLHELALITESKKRMVPIFCDMKPSELRVKDNANCPAEDLRRFNLALEEAKFTVGLTFNTSNGDWSEFLRSALDTVIKNLLEVEEENRNRNQKIYPHQCSMVVQANDNNKFMEAHEM